MDDDEAAVTGTERMTAPIARAVRGTGGRLHSPVAHKLGVATMSGEYSPGDTLSGEVAFSASPDVLRNAYAYDKLNKCIPAPRIAPIRWGTDGWPIAEY